MCLPAGQEVNWVLDTGELSAILLEKAGFGVKTARNGKKYAKHLENGWEKSNLE